MRRQDPRIKTSADKTAERVFNEAAKLPTPELVRAVVGAQVNDTDPMRASMPCATRQAGASTTCCPASCQA